MSTGAHTSPTGIRRIAMLGILAVALAGAVVIAINSDDDVEAFEPTPVVAMAPPGADGVAFFCAAGSSSPDGHFTETIVLNNLATTPATATITLAPGGDEAPVSREVALDPETQVRVPVSEILAVPDPGVTVEVHGGEVSVAHAVGPSPVASAPCARRASTRWYLAGGTTVRGIEQWLALYNPFPTEAILDVTFYTEEGTKRPENLRGLTVHGNSRRNVAVHDEVRRLNVVALEVEVRVGRIVAEQVLRGNGDEAYRGSSLSLAVPALRDQWVVADGMKSNGSAEALVVMNPSDTESQVRVSTLLRDPELSIEPSTTIIPPRSAIPIALPEGLPDSVAYSHVVEVVDGPPVALEQRMTRTSAPTSIRTDSGLDTPAIEWLVPLPREGTEEAYVVVVNTRDDEVEFDVSLIGGGTTRTPEAGQGIRVLPHNSVAVSLAELGVVASDSLVVRAAAPVWVAQVGAAGATRSAAVPQPE